MPTLSIHGADIHYDDVGNGPETIVFIHGLMLASDSFAAQREAFRRTHRVVTFDLRGQGKSAKTRERLDIDSLTEDTAALIQALGCAPCHLVGFSMGTFVALRLAARRPELVRSLTLIGPSADAEEPQNMSKYAAMIFTVRLLGPRFLAARLMRILFGKTFLAAPERAPERERWRRYVEQLPRTLHRAASASAHRQSIAHELAAIRAPALIVSGEEDLPIKPERALAVHRGLTGSELMRFPKTGHAVMLERPDEFNLALAIFLRRIPAWKARRPAGAAADDDDPNEAPAS